MPVLDITVSLSEVLEVQGTPLQEPEIWATLCQSAELLQDLFLKGEAVSDVGPTFVIFPDTISLCSNGKIEFSDPSRMVVGHSPAAPETLGHMVMSDTAIEKIYVYSVGRSLYEAATYGLGFDQPMNISRGLDTLLHAMCEEDPSVRVALVDVLEACAEYVKKHPTEPTYSQSASRLYRSVLGDADDDDVTLDSTHGSDKCHQSIFSLTPRSKKSRRKPRHSRYKGRNNEKSLSRSPSRSRSRSPQRHHRYDEKTDREYFRNGDSFNRHYYKASSHIEGCIKKDKLLHQDFQDYHGILPCDRNQSQPVFHVNQPHSPRYMKDTGKINGHHSSQSNIGHPVYEKYKKLKERQRKLRALRQGLFRENIEEDSLLLTDRMECMSDTRSLLSLASYTQGMYMPDVHTHYGSETALRMGRDSDRESVISSEISLLHQDSNSMRAGSDTIDPFIQDLQQIPHPPSNSTSHHKQNDEEHKTTITKPKDFVGPEFVYRATKPIARILMPLQGESMKNPVHVRRVVVVLLTGQKLEVMCDPCTTGQQLFEAVITHISLPEFFFFGLTYISDGEHFFVESDMKLHKVAPSGWRDGGKGNMATITLTVYLRIKYYVDNLLTFRHHVTRHLLYLQLRRDILEDRSQCSEDKSLTLAGLSLQAEYGDYDKDMNGRSYFVPEHYFSHRVIQRVGTAYVRDNGAEMHAAARDMTEMQAEMDFIREVQKLPEYGVHFYKLFKNKNDTNSPIWIGIASSCLLIAESMGNQRNIIHQHPWGKTQKISFKKRRFSVQPKTDYGQAKPLKMNFYTNSYKKGHYLLQFSTAQHRFLLKMKARAADPDLQDVMMDSGSVEDENMVMVGGDNGLEAQFANDDRDNTDVDSQKQRNASAEIELQNPENKEMQNAVVSYMNPPLYRSNHGISMEELREQYVINPSLRLPFERDAYDDGNLKCSPMHGSEYGSTPHITDERVMEHDDYYLDMSNKSLGRSLHHLPAEPTSDTLHERFNKEFLSPVPLDREMFEVALRKEPHFGIGITIVGGENTDRLDLGIFVKSVIQEGPADQDGRLKPGDRIIAINGYSLEGKQHHVAVKMIQDAVDEVTLLISHVRPPKTIRRKVYGDTSAEDKLSIFVNSDDDVNTCNRVEAENDIMYRSNPSSSIDSALTRDYLHGQHDINDISQIHQPNISTLTSDSSVHSRMSARNSITTESLPDDEYSDTNDNKVYPSTDYRDDSSTDSDFDNAIETIVVGKQKTGNDTFLVKKTCNKPDITDDTFRVKPIVVTTNKSFINDKCTNVTSVKNQKKNGCFEIMIAGEKENKSKNNQISGLLPGGTAEHEGIIVTGGINGFANTLQCNNNIALTELDNEDSVDELGCSHSLASRSSTQKMELDEIGKKYFPFVMKDNTFEVELNKGSGGVGLCISCVEDNHPNDPFQGIVWVKQVSPFGPAAASQKFQQGDIILEVNKQQLKGLMKSENRSLLRGASNPVRLLICRPHSDQIPPWLQDEMEESFLSITPMSSISTTSASTISESDNEKITFRHQVIAPPVQFNSTHPPNEYIDDSDCDMFEEHGDVFYKPVSPPPAPSSSPPTINLNSLRNTPTNEVAIDSQHNLFLNLKLDNIPCTDTNNDNTPQQVEEIDEDIMSEFNRLSNKGDNVDFPRNSCISDKKLILRNQDKIVHYNGRNASKLESVDLLNSSGEGLSNVNNNISGSSEDRFIDFTLESLKSCDVKECLSLDQIDIDTHEQSESSESMLGSPQLSLDMPSSDEEEIDPLKPGEFELILTKRESGGLGFTVAGGANTTGGCFIKSIVQDPALSDGRLRPGDKLIKVNGYDMMSLSHFEAVTLLRQAPQVVTIRISRDPDLWESTDISATSASEETLFDGSAILVNHFSSPRNRNGKASFPSSVASCEKPVLDEHSLESVQILSPNDDKQRIQGLSNTSNSIHSTERPQKTSGKILLSTAAESNEEVSCAFSSLQREFLLDDAMSNLKLSDKDIIQVELQMQEQSGLGFSMVLAESHKQMEIIIKSIAPGGVAAQNGRLQIGDRLLQINEESLVDLNRTEAIAMLKKVSGRVILTVSRSQCHKLEWSTVSDSESEVSKSSAIKHQGTHVDEDTAITDISSCESTDGEDDNVDILVAEAEQYLHESETIDLEPSKLNSVTLTPLESRNNPSIYSDVDTSNDNCSENRSFNFKKLNVNIPETITDNWLSMLPLVTVPEELRIRIPSLIGKLQEKIEQHETLDEFKTLRHRKNVDSIDVASQAKNKNKNRFRNVLPYDKNRVILDGENNYINASHITMAFATGKNHYIASQGPLLHTADEFWIMVWEQQSDVIVMLTQDMEARKVKCHRYWPDFVETPLLVSKNQHKIEVTLVSLQTTANIDIRLLQMKHQKTYETHQVNHLVYTSWPDHGVPDSAIPLLQYLQLVHMLHHSGPVIVHCSAGIGRTGTFITVDTMLTYIEKGQECSIFEIVKELRKQRSGMIQTKDQYMFCFSASIEALLG